MAEWLNARDSKSCIRQPRIKGSNPFVSARIKILKIPIWGFFDFNRRNEGMRQSAAHGEYENTQLEKSQKSQGQDFCRFLLLCIEDRNSSPPDIKIKNTPDRVFLNFEIIVFDRFNNCVDDFILV